MAEPYTPDQRAFQDRFDARRMADRLTVMTTDVVDEAHQRFIGAREAFFLATVLRRLLGVVIRMSPTASAADNVSL